MGTDVATYNAVNQIAPVRGARMSRVMAKLRFGQAVGITAVGDSVLEGTTCTSGGGTLGTDDALSLLRSAIAAAYPQATVTMHNRAISGRTMAMLVRDEWASALADNADVYILSSGKNELAAYTLSAPGSLEGQSFASSLAMLESKVAELRAAQPTAVIIIMPDNPYSAANTANAYQQTWNAGAERIAWLYGCEFADGYRAFTALGSWDSLLSDGTHPNGAAGGNINATSGHALLARTLLSVFPLAWSTAYARRQAPLGVPASTPSVAYPPLPAAADRAALPWRYNRLGVQSLKTITNPTTSSGYRWWGGINGNGSAHQTGTSPYTTTTAGDTALFTICGNEAFLDLVMGASQGTVQIYIDGSPLKFNGTLVGSIDLSLRANGKLLHLTEQCGMAVLGWHTVAVTLISGSMTVNGCYYVAGRSQWIDQSSPSVVAAGMGSTAGLGSSPSGGNGVLSAAAATQTVKFWGTGVGAMFWRSSTGGPSYMSASFVDGNAVVPPLQLRGGDTNSLGYMSQIIQSGLTYGLHTLVVNWSAAGLYSLGYFPIDEQAHLRPNQLDGWAGAGEVVKFGAAFPTVPTLTGDAGVVFGSVTAAGFTNTGTAGSWHANAIDSTAANALAY